MTNTVVQGGQVRVERCVPPHLLNLMRQLSKQAAPCKSLWHYLLTRRICHKCMKHPDNPTACTIDPVFFCWSSWKRSFKKGQAQWNVIKHLYRIASFVFFMIPWALFYTGQLLHLSKFKISSLAVTFKSAKKYNSHHKNHEKDTTEGLVEQAPRSQGTLPQFPFSCSKPASTSGLPLSSSHRWGLLGRNWTLENDMNNGKHWIMFLSD